MTPVEVVSVYGPTNAGVRARALGFLERLALPWHLQAYFGSRPAGTRRSGAALVDAARSEMALRRALRQPPERLFLRREASPLGRGRIEQRLLRRAGHGVYDLDDALHHDVRGGLFELMFSKGAKASRSAAAADVVIVGNDYLAEWAAHRARDVRVIPTCVEPTDYTRKEEYQVGDPPRLLWLGTFSGERYLRAISPALLRIHEDTGARLTIMGDGRSDLDDLAPMTDRRPWGLQEALAGIAEYDVGIMPLQDRPYEKGKCAYKLLEYGAAGVPVVASPVGVNAAILAEAGAAAPMSVDEWYEALRQELDAPPDTRRSRADRLREIVTRNFSFERWLPDWRDAVDV